MKKWLVPFCVAVSSAYALARGGSSGRGAGGGGLLGLLLGIGIVGALIYGLSTENSKKNKDKDKLK